MALIKCTGCGTENPENGKYCTNCGKEITPSVKTCPNCGKEIIEGGKYCANCGYSLQLGNVQVAKSEFPNNDTQSSGGKKITASYVISSLGTFITFRIRVSLQEKFTYWETLVKRAAYIGLDESIKPWLSIIPLLMAFIATLLIISDKTKSTQKKAIAFVVNALLVIIAVACILYNIPSEITY